MPTTKKVSAADVIVFSIAVLVLWLALVELPEPATTGLDDSWRATLAYASAHHLGFGTDLVFTYGPLGYLIAGVFDPAHLHSKLIWEIGGKLALSATLVWLALPLPRFRRILFVVLLVLEAHYIESVCLAAVGLLAIFWLIRPAPARGQAALALLWITFLSQLKFVFFLEGLAVLLVAVASTLLEGRRRDTAVIGIGYALLTLFWWLISGQSLSGFPAYLHGSWEISSGYSWAMALDPQATVLLAGLAVWIFAIVIALQVKSSTALNPVQTWATILAGACVWFIAWKQGFTRADLHVQAYFSTCVLFGFALAGTGLRRGFISWGDLNLLACVIGMAAEAAWLPLDGPRWAVSHVSQNPARIVSLGDFGREYAAKYQERQKAAADDKLVRSVGDGSVAMIGFEQAILTYNNLNYRPLPILQSYSSYEPFLQRLDATFFARDDAPAFVVNRLKTVDGRYPGQDDALALREIARNYDFAGSGDGYDLFRRKPAAPGPASDSQVNLGAESAGLGSDVTVPSGNGFPIWLQADIRPTLLGGLRAFFYHSAPLRISFSDNSARVEQWLLVPGTTVSGFLIDPLIGDFSDFSNFVAGRSRRWARSLKIEGEQRYWKAPRLEFQALAGRAVNHWTLMDSAVESGAINVHPISLTSAVAVNVQELDGRHLIFAHAPSSLELPVPAGSATLSGGFGFIPGAYLEGETDGADFEIQAVDSQGRATSLWKQSLRPRSTRSDQGFQSLLVSVPAGTVRLLLTINPGIAGNNGWDWTFWSDIRIQ